MRQSIFILTIFLFANSFLFGQKTPEDLGRLVFNVFKYHDTAALDTLTPTCKEVIDIYIKIDSSLEFIKDPDFPRKYEYHDKQFKEKCGKIMSDSVHLGIDWKNISLVNVEYIETKVEGNGSTDTTPKSTTINYLNIYFLSGQKKYSLEFKGIYKSNEIWKLGEHMRIRNSDN